MTAVAGVGGPEQHLPPGGEVLGVRAAGPEAVLLEVTDHVAAGALAAWVRASPVRCREVVPAARTVLLDGLHPEDLARLDGLLRQWPGAAPTHDPGDGAGDGAGDGRASARVVEVPVVYDGEDLEQVARVWGTTVTEVVRRHTATEFVAAFCGFAPGFSYLAGLPGELAVPRLAVPRTRVPAGAVALADRWCGVYPAASPGGWLLLGRTAARVWDSSRTDRPALLPPGTRVRFTEA